MSQFWNLTPPHARWETNDFSATLDLPAPRAGLAISHKGSPTAQPPACRVLGVDFKSEAGVEPADSYQRGPDLVVTYPDRPIFPVRVQVYWRVLAPEQLPDPCWGFDLQVSVQTPLWETCPVVTTVSHFTAVKGLRLVDAEAGRFAAIHASAAEVGGSETLPCPNGVSCTLLRLKHLPDLSYVELVHPADAGADEVWTDATAQGPAWRLGHTLFENNLEKGVILRARLRGLFVPRHNDEGVAAEAYREFVQSALPLTT